MSTPPSDPRPPVVIVGGGPVGLVAALLLAEEGVPSVVLERDGDPPALPRAAHLDDEALRVLQRLRLLDALAPHLAPTPAYELLDGRGALVARIDRTGRPLGQPRSALLHQPGLDAVLRAAAEAHPAVDLRTGWTVVGLDGATVRAQDPSGADVAVPGWMVLGCDGAASTVRGLLGVGVRDRGFEQRWLVLDVLLHGPRPAGLDLPQQRCDPSRPTTSVPISATRHRFELLLGDDEAEAAALDPRSVGGHLVRLLGRTPASVERAAVYTFHALDATAWRVGDVVLLGDAAHQMPPFLGQGLCSGIGDAANLAWKLGFVHRGLAGDALLGTYAAERRAHVAAAIRLSALLGRVVTGAGPGWAAGRRLGAGALAGLPALRRRVAALGPPPLPPGPLAVPAAGVGPAASRWAGRGAVGRPLPQPLADAGGGPVPLDDLLGGFALLGIGVDPLEGVDPAAAAVWAALGARRIAVLPGGVPRPVGVAPGLVWVDDAGGDLAAWFRRAGARRAIVRPDRVVLGVAADADGVARATAPLARLLG